MLIRHAPDLTDNDVTDQASTCGGASSSAGRLGLGLLAAAGTASARGLAYKPGFSTTETPTPKKDITSYNNFYEFGVNKEDPSENAGSLKTRPWTVRVDGECEKPASFAIDDLIKANTLEERIYRMRCVEGWSMVIPWVGFPLKDLIAQVKPTSKAKFVAFETLMRPSEMPGQRWDTLQWPYREGLRIDEATHPSDPLGRRPVRRCPAQPERRAAAAGRAVEVRVQGHQVDRADQPGREDAGHRLERAGPARVRLLFQRQSGRGPSALVAGHRAPDRRVPPP
jgi:hypothetical protein